MIEIMIECSVKSPSALLTDMSAVAEQHDIVSWDITRYKMNTYVPLTDIHPNDDFLPCVLGPQSCCALLHFGVSHCSGNLKGLNRFQKSD